MRSHIRGLLYYHPFNYLLKTYMQGLGSILMLHRVNTFDSNNVLPNGKLIISPCYLETLIVELRRSGFEFVSLDDIYDFLIGIKKRPKKFISITLDDGYLDNLEVAFPIFVKYNIPFSIYVTTSFPDRTAVLWWYILEELINSNSHLLLGNGIVYNCLSNEEKIKTFFDLRSLFISVPRCKRNDFIIDTLKNYDIDLYSSVKNLALSWDQIKEISEHKLCTIGAHSVNHVSFASLSEDEIKEEALCSRNRIHSMIGKEINHFAYPFGSLNESGLREYAVLKKLGFKTITTTRPGNIHKEHLKYLEALPRIYIYENCDFFTQVYFDPFFINHYKRVVY